MRPLAHSPRIETDGTLPLGFCRLGIAIFVTTLNGECEEHEIAHAFLEAMPFVSLLVVFFGVVAIIEEQHIFTPIINAVLGLPNQYQPVALYLSNGSPPTPACHSGGKRRSSLTGSVCAAGLSQASCRWCRTTSLSRRSSSSPSPQRTSEPAPSPLLIWAPPRPSRPCCLRVGGGVFGRREVPSGG